MSIGKQNPRDYNLDNYTDTDLYKILGFSDDATPTRNAVESSINNLIGNVGGDKQLNNFLTEASNRLLFGRKGKDIANMWQKEYATTKGSKDRDVRTNRYNQVTTTDDANEHFVMFRNKLNVSTAARVPISQGSINPNLKNIVSRTVTIDSQYRKNIFDKANSTQSTNAFVSNTDFILEFSEHLHNVLDMKLQSICIPATWYVFSKELGNTCMKIVDINEKSNKELSNSHHLLPYCGCIRDGNPDFDTLEEWLNDAFQYVLSFQIDPNSHKITMTNKTNVNIRVFFYKPHGLSNNMEKGLTDSSFGSVPCGNGCYSSGYTNFNLAWELGFRTEPDIKTGEVFIDIGAHGHVVAPYMVNINGPKYLTMSIDDFNHNHINNGMINILEKGEIASLPTYYNPSFQGDITKSQLDANNNKSLATEGELTELEKDITTSCTDLSNKKNSKVPYVAKNVKAPRNLTAAQIYSINEIISNRQAISSRHSPPGITNTFAHIPLINIRPFLKDRSHYTIQGVDLHSNNRSYFGPVKIKRMRVTLYDDKGHKLNLNGHNWSANINVDMLYQY